MSGPYLFGEAFHKKWFAARPLSEEEKKRRRLERSTQEDASLSLHNTERLFRQLMVNRSFVTIDAAESARIYKLFRGKETSPSKLRFSHRAFLQAAMMAAIDGSFAMGFVEVIFKSAFMKPVVDRKSFASVLKKLARGGLKHLFHHARNKDLMEAEVYETIVVAIAWQCRPYFEMIDMGEDL